VGPRECHVARTFQKGEPRASKLGRVWEAGSDKRQESGVDRYGYKRVVLWACSPEPMLSTRRKKEERPQKNSKRGVYGQNDTESPGEMKRSPKSLPIIGWSSLKGGGRSDEKEKCHTLAAPRKRVGRTDGSSPSLLHPRGGLKRKGRGGRNQISQGQREPAIAGE